MMTLHEIAYSEVSEIIDHLILSLVKMLAPYSIQILVGHDGDMTQKRQSWTTVTYFLVISQLLFINHHSTAFNLYVRRLFKFVHYLFTSRNFKEI